MGKPGFSYAGESIGVVKWPATLPVAGDTHEVIGTFLKAYVYASMSRYRTRRSRVVRRANAACSSVDNLFSAENADRVCRHLLLDDLLSRAV